MHSLSQPTTAARRSLRRLVGLLATAATVLACISSISLVAPPRAQALDLSHYKDLIEKFGVKGIHFLECMGPEYVEHSSAPTLKALRERDPQAALAALNPHANECIENAGVLQVRSGAVFGVAARVVARWR